MNRFELPKERLATTDEEGRRVFVHPADVRGRFRRLRGWAQLVLIVFFLCLPWMRIDGRQAFLLNISEREFEIFGLSLRAHNAPLLVFIFCILGFGIFFVTAVWGRIWCGWACPQTVFIDGVFRRIERWIEGPALKRRTLDQTPMSLEKLRKRSLKWALFLLTGLAITHSFLAYFVGTERLAEMMTETPSKNWESFLFMSFATLVIVFDFAWFREQFCTLVCPYGRLQSILMDSRSMVVAYDGPRGEPRATPEAKKMAKSSGARLGDCVGCYRCVQVCPTGIDIRRGLQMECIACTACIDACDEVMTKIKKPTGLIRYTSKYNLSLASYFRPRVLVYFSLLLLSVSGLITALVAMDPVDVAIFRAKDTPYSLQKMSDDSPGVLNHFKVELSNQSGSLHNLTFTSDEMAQGLELVTAHRPLPLTSGLVARADLFVRFPKRLLSNGQKKIRLSVHDEDTKTGTIKIIEREVTLVGPFF